MPPKRKYHTEEERKAAVKAQRKAYEARNPEIIKEKRRRENQKAKEGRKSDTRVCKTCKQEKPITDYAPKGGGFLYVCMTCRPDTIPKARKSTGSPGNEVRTKICSHCGIIKPIDQFARHGTHGRKDSCKDCKRPEKSYRTTKVGRVALPLLKRKDMVYDALERKEKEPVRWGNDVNHQGWILILGAFTPGSMGETAWMKDGILKLLHRNGSASFQIMGDTKGRSWRTLGGVKRALERMGA